jgi:formyltetrahydrofolate synthetase
MGVILTLRSLKSNIERAKYLNQGALNGGSTLLSLVLINFIQNFFPPSFLRTDSQAEWKLLEKASLESGAFRAVVCKHWAQGGAGALELAEAVIEACNEPSEFRCSIPLVFKV